MTADDGIARLDLARAKQRAHRNEFNRAEPLNNLPPPNAPMAVARKFVPQCCRHAAADQFTLRFWHGGWWGWRTSHWVEVENRTVRSLLYTFTEHAVYVHTFKGMQVTTPWDPDPSQDRQPA